MRTTFDFAPLWRSTVGFDHLAGLVDSALRQASEDNYPPITSNAPAKITTGSASLWRALASTISR